MTTREQLRARIDLLECLEGVTVAIDDMEGNELLDATRLRLRVSKIVGNGEPICAYAHGLTPALVLVGLRAMQSHLEAALKPMEVA
jgi:hypothetical protein